VRPRAPALATPSRQPDFVDEDVLPEPKAGHELDPLLGKRTKGKARVAPLAIFVFVVLIFLATR